VNDFFLALSAASWKPFFGALLLPPVPLLVLVLFGATQIARRRWLGWLLVLVGVLGLWLCTTTALSRWLTLSVLQAPMELSASEVVELKKSPKTAIVVLGGGRRATAGEYGGSAPTARTLERLRYGIWLGRETGLPVAFSGGIGRGEVIGQTEAEIASRIAEREFRAPLRWVENQSRDTRENALMSVAMLKSQGIERIVLVTHAYHMPRALRNFERAAAGSSMRVTTAATGRPTPGALKPVDWRPTLRGMEDTWLALHECLGLLAGS